MVIVTCRDFRNYTRPLPKNSFLLHHLLATDQNLYKKVMLLPMILLPHQTDDHIVLYFTSRSVDEPFITADEYSGEAVDSWR